MTTHDIALATISFIAGMSVIRLISWLMDDTEMSKDIESVSNSNLIATSAPLEKIHKSLNQSYIDNALSLIDKAKEDILHQRVCEALENLNTVQTILEN